MPLVAGFSSRGPSVGMAGDVIKPDLSAPGVGVLAAVAPPTNAGRTYDFLSGTSMSSPHVAGLAALLRGKHPTWSPSAVKSALMTTGRNHATFGGIKGDDPFAQGAGFVQPVKANTPGLVYEQSTLDYLQFLEGQCGCLDFDGDGVSDVDPIEANQLNLASIAEGAMAGTFSVTRTVTNVGAAGKFKASVDLPGIDVKVAPSELDLTAGGTGTFTVTFTRTSATLDNYATGFLTWTGGGTTVRSPLAVRPVAIAAPGEVSGGVADGSATVTVIPGATGNIVSKVAGLVGATPVTDSVVTGPFDATAPAVSAAVKKYTITVPAGTALTRIDVDSLPAADDLDLYLYDDKGKLVALSATGAGDEQITELGLAPGTYTAYLNGYATPGGGSYKITTWNVGTATAGNATVTSPVAGTLGVPVDLTLAWTGLDAAQRYLGWIGYTVDGSAASDVTVVSIG